MCATLKMTHSIWIFSVLVGILIPIITAQPVNLPSNDITGNGEVIPISILGNEVTYPGLETFKKLHFSGKHPFDIHLPDNPWLVGPKFYLYTQTNNKDHQILGFNDTKSILESNFDGSKATKLVVHGYIDGPIVGSWLYKLKDVILDHEDANVILAFWPLGNKLLYGQAVANTRVVGAMMGIQIELLSQLTSAKLAHFHVIGHSLGSHIAGYAGKYLKGELGRITGLDPAGPCYEGYPPEARLWHTDAKFVDAIHSNALPLFPNKGFGMYETCSHVDIYPNGGRRQPGCEKEFSFATDGIIDSISNTMRYFFSCNHQRSVDFFTASFDVTDPMPKAYECASFEDFQAGKCAECGQNGEKCALLGPQVINYRDAVKDINANLNGTNGKRFFLVTDRNAPFLNKYQYLVNINMASTQNASWNFDKLSQIQISFVSKNGHSELFPFNENDELKTNLKLGHSYSYSGVLETDIGHLAKLDFRFKRAGWNIIDWYDGKKLHVESVEVIALSSSEMTAKSASTKAKFCDTNFKEGIANSKYAMMELC